MGVEEQRAGKFYVERDVLDELCLDQVARRRTHSTTPPLKERVKDSLRCSMPKLKRSVLSTLPVLSWLPRYSVRDNGLGDLISGISVGIMHLPQGMAYALLASVPPVFGLYTSFYPVLVYCILGTSRHISIGTFAVISIMIGSVTERLAPDSDFTFLNGTNGTAVLDVTARDAYRVQIAASTTVLSGLFQVLLGMVRFGFVVTYLSEPLVRGYTTGAATHVVVSQLKYIFGIHPARFSGPLSQILIDICRHLPETNIGALVVSLVALVVLIVVKELNSCYEKKLPLPIPIELIVIVAATLISYYGNLNSQYDVAVVGEIPRGLKSPSLPDVSLWGTVVGDAFAVAIVGYAINISLGKTFGLKHGYKVDSNQELVALGLSNTVGGFFQCYSVTSSMSRSLIQESTGGRTQVAGVVSSVIVLITVLQLGTLFGELPKAVLSCIVFVNLKGMFKQYLDIPALWKSNTVDLLVWLVTLVCTILLNLDLGLAASIAFSLLTVIFRTQLPRYSILGQVPGTELYLDTDTYEEAKEIPGITIFRSSTTVYYTNAELYLDALQKKSGIDVGKLLTRKKKRDAKQKRKDKKEEKKQRGRVVERERVVKREREWWRERGGEWWRERGRVVEREGESDESKLVQHKQSRRKTRPSYLTFLSVSFHLSHYFLSLLQIFRDYREIDIDIYLAGCQGECLC
uniref:Solute carrier family 26 member 6, like 2 n=1 Tax=Oncorhynchus mykiss TaxID=8022 RepID=A0A8K9XP39_ONCMY